MSAEALTPEQWQAVELLSAGVSERRTAEVVGIARNTLRSWRQHDLFAEAFNQACAKAHRANIAAMHRGQKRATTTLLKALSNPDANVAVRAALGLLTNGWKAAEHFVLDERLKAVEARQNASQPGQTASEGGDAKSVGPEPADAGPEGVLPLPAG